MRLVIIVLIVFLIGLWCMSVKKENFYDNLYGDGDRSCQEYCTEMHPNAARMDLDEDNDIADTVMSQCLAQCRQLRGGGNAKCKSCA